MAGTAVQRVTPENEVARQRAKLLASGEQTYTQGVGAIRAFNPEDYLGADALKSIFDEATVRNFLPQLRELQARNSRRGVRGPLAGATEGDLGAAFQRQLLGKVAEFGSTRAQLALGRGQALTDAGGTERAQGISLLGTQLQMQLAREQMKRDTKNAWINAGGKALGAAASLLSFL